MSLTSDEMQRLQSYVRQDAEASALFEKLLLSYEMERHKICHEIRNPLTLLSSTIQLIESQHPEMRSFDYWNSLREDLDYMMELLQEFSLYNNSNSRYYIKEELRYCGETMSKSEVNITEFEKIARNITKP